MRTSGVGRSDAWMVIIPLGALLIFTSFASGGPENLVLSLDSMVRGAWQSVAQLVSSYF
jgi:hypothetical protein